jgi:hypothetical protein
MKVELVTQGQNWGGDLPFFFNLSQPVGRGQPNTPQDVGFVQFCFATLARAPSDVTAFEQIPIYAQVQVTRTINDRTQNAIDEFLAIRRRRSGFAKPDGIFHAVPRGVSTSYARDTPYAIVALNFLVLHANKAIWPRLDMAPLAEPIAGDIRAAISSSVTA